MLVNYVRCNLVIWFFLSTPYLKAAEFKVSNTTELKMAIQAVNQLPLEEPAELILADGEYLNATNMQIRHPWTHIRSHSYDPDKVVLIGNGMRKAGRVELIFDISASHVTIAGLTLKNVAHHLIQVRAERNVDYFILKHCILQNAYQQLLKVSGSPEGEHADYGVITHNRFEYTAGIGPNYYIGGIDAHRSRKWTVKHNTFSNIASPSDKIAEHAIHFWRDSSDIEVTHNLILNSDRGIGFGLGETGTQARGGLIAYNNIIHTEQSHPFADVGIGIESSPDTIISKNVIYMTTAYPHAIEYRFAQTQNVVIEANITNKAIAARDGGSAILINNRSAGAIEKYSESFLYWAKKKL